MQADEGGLADLRQALEIAYAESDDTNAAYIAHDLGNALVHYGQLQEAQASFHQALMHWRKAGNVSDVALTLQGLGVIAHHLGEYEEAEERLNESLAKAVDNNDQRLQAYAHANLAELFRDLCRYDEAQAHAQRAMELASRAKAQDLMVFVGVLQADILRLQGDATLARQLAQEALDQAIASDMPYEAALARSILAMAALSQGGTATAINLLQHALQELEETGAPRDIARAHLQLGLAHLQDSDPHEAGRHLHDVQQLIQSLGSAQVLVTEGPAAIDQLDRAQQSGLCAFDLAAVRVLAHRGVNAVPTSTSEEPPDLAFYALDGGQVRVRGELATRWESAVAREMAFLLAANPRGLRRDTIIEMLWPESEPDKGNSLFHSTLYRVRRALGQKVIARASDRYSFDSNLSLYLDAAVFEDLARKALSEGDREARSQALALYHEPFLSSCELQWCYQQREQLSRLLSELLVAEAQDRIAQGDTHGAEEAFNRLLELDDLDERAYRGVMWCRSKHGDEAGATRAYMQCRKALRAELGVEPESATRKMWDAIRHHEPLPEP
ncbi:MAG: tetratricopeptide repeat protein [Anaerolineales bacterium]